MQKIKDIDIFHMIEIANKLYDKIVKVDINKVLKRQEEMREAGSVESREKKTITTKIYDVVTKKTGELFNGLIEMKAKLMNE